jgi:hypothetical protein
MKFARNVAIFGQRLLTQSPTLEHIWRMTNAPVRPRNFLYTAIAFAALGGLMMYNDSEFKYTLIGFVPCAVFLAVFIWTLSTEKRF